MCPEQNTAVTKILHLTVTRKWFALIAAGIKTAEFRSGKPYWKKRLQYKNGVAVRYDEVHFRNGYRPDSPFARVEWSGLSTWDLGENKDGFHLGPCGEDIFHGDFQISLGRVLEIRHWQNDGPVESVSALRDTI